MRSSRIAAGRRRPGRRRPSKGGGRCRSHHGSGLEVPDAVPERPDVVEVGGVLQIVDRPVPVVIVVVVVAVSAAAVTVILVVVRMLGMMMRGAERRVPHDGKKKRR